MPRIDNDVKLDFKDVLFRPKRSTLRSRSDVDLTRTFIFRNSGQTYTGIPVMVANMDTTGTFEMAKAIGKEWKEFARENKDIIGHVAASTGTGENDLKKLKEILDAVPEVKFLCVDVANGYSEHFAGNVVTGEMVEELILSGADIIKVGIGPGSVCTTRKKTGVGYPQLSAVIECADAAHGLAFGAGADFVMLGGMFAGHEESGGEMVEQNGKKASEGKTVQIEYRGPVENTLQDILGGVRSTCTYVGAGKLKELSRRTTFIRVTQQLNEVFAASTKEH
ncbi:GMPR2-like protein [Mya arenaria]|uniref:GMP reductase n=1 Tax=Mya arenaria TaxID=6604 RepID=A0ABY7ES96_MYAAR|nr:GMPR2-like protein [Mya arenaria]WAR12129.1 GMPR2-like protein [Mya arenaria]